ncbi:CpaF family protein, partial [Candidatus Micrarchaeota archaeon]|nr:CpaF family protein [Candidatus Micrarchaeota archaeon]
MNGFEARKNFLGWWVEPPGEAFGEGQSVLVANGKYLVNWDPLSAGEENLLELLIKKFRENVKESEMQNADNVRKKLILVLREICETNKYILDRKKAERLISLAVSDVYGYGVFDLVLADDSLEEISVIGLNRPIYVFHRSEGWLKTNCFIEKEEFAINAINKMARPLGRRVTYQNPRLNATLPSGARLHASILPITLNEVEITIRKFKQNPLSIADLITNKTVSSEVASFLWMVSFGDKSVLVCGNSGSGKTTTLNALFSFIPMQDRVVIVEETPEINIPHPHQVKMVANDELGVHLKDLVKDTLRMRPDRVVVGEVRSSGEVEALCDSLLSGQARGTYATFHAGSSEEAIMRLQALGMRREDLGAIDLLLVQRRIPLYSAPEKKQYEVRRITELVEIAKNKRRQLFLYNPKKDSLEKKNDSMLLEQVCENYG